MATEQVGNYTVRLSKRLGQGTYGTVYRAKDNRTNATFAVKHTRWEKQYVSEETYREANLLRDTEPHENIINVIALESVDAVEFGIRYVDIYMFMDFCELGDLSILARRSALTFEQKTDVMLQCCVAIHHLHSQEPPIIHRDIKPGNILVSRSKDSPDSLTFRLADFGISRLFERDPNFKLKTMTAGMGTFPYMAPELFDDVPKYDEKVDTYSGGVSFISVLVSKKGEEMEAPKAGKKELGRHLHDVGEIEVAEVQDKPGDTMSVRKVKMILREMTEIKPQSRPNSRELVDRFTRICSPHKDVWKNLDGYEPQTEGATGESGSGDSATGTMVPSTSLRDRTLQSQPGSASATPATPRDNTAPAKPGKSFTSKVKGLARGMMSPFKKSSGSASATSATSDDSPAPSTPGGLRVQKVSSTVLPVRGRAAVDFGEGNFIVGYKDDDKFHFHEVVGNEYDLKWQKPIPEGHKYNQYRHVSTMSTTSIIFIHYSRSEVYQYNGALELIGKLPSPGVMICLLSGGRLAVLDDWASHGSDTRPRRLTVAPVENLKRPVARLGVPKDGPYTRQDKLHACGRADGTVAVISVTKPFVDIYDSSGGLVTRTALPSGAEKPGCSSSYLLVPLREKPPSICVLSWQGRLLHTLGHEELALGADARGSVVSSIWHNRFSFKTTSSDHIIHTYEVTEGVTEEKS